MDSLTDQQLLCDYAENRSEAAFAELARRKVDLVYSAALRMVGDAHLAEDVTQTAFAALAQNASQLKNRAVLSGWLHRTAQNVAAKVVRADVRRRAREQEAVAMNELLSAEADVPWDHIAPQLDAALSDLSETDRDSLILRYFDRKSTREMASLLGVSEDAAQKRVSRAIERLREIFAKRGVRVGASGLAVVLSANAIQSAPAGFAVAISAAAFTPATVTTIAMITTQKTIVAAALVIAVAAGIYEARQASQLRGQVQSLGQRQESLTGQLEELRKQNAATAKSQALSQDQVNELLRLRAEHRDLQAKNREIETLREENRQIRLARTFDPNSDSANPVSHPVVPRESWAFVGYDTPEDAFQSATWALSKGDLKTLLNSETPDVQQQMAKAWEGRSQAEVADDAVKEMTDVTGFRILGKIAISPDEVNLFVHTEGEDLSPTFIMKKIDNEWKIASRVKYTPF